MLALAGAFTFVSVSRDLNDSIDETLALRTGNLIEQVIEAPGSKLELGASEDPEDSFSQIIRADGTLVDSSSPSLVEPVLDSGDLALAEAEEALFEVSGLPGVDGKARLLARPADRDGQSLVVVAGAGTEDRDETLSGLVRTFLITAPVALLLASLAGYGLATVAMRPVERMRRKAGEITLDRNGERLPLPASRDEIHRLGQTLNGMLDRIEQSLDRERCFVADASHELRTPLAIARSELELGLRPDRDLSEARAAMASAQEEVVRLEGLTNDLLTLARSDNAGVPLDRTDVQVPDLLESIRNRFEPLVEAEGRQLQVVPGPAVTARLDRSRIEQALANLVGNALHHGDGEITLSSQVASGSIEFIVTDEGQGFPDEFAGQAFERFARAEAGRTSSGNGLGLAIVKAVAEAHGGSASLGKSESGGAEVVMRIPI